MDSVQNPFTPGAGTRPHALVGRDEILEQTRVLLGRVRAGRSAKSVLLTGLRGVGKTVLLLEMECQVHELGYRSIWVEAHEGKSLAALLVPGLRKTFLELDRLAGVGDKARRGLAYLKNFVGAFKVAVGDVEVGMNLEPERGIGDTGDLEVDLPNLLASLAEAAAERNTLVAILIDEIQYLTPVELSALIMGMHRIQQRRLPLVLLGAGLPILPGLAAESKSYAERLFSFPVVDRLTETEAVQALRDPVRAEGVDFEDDALREIFKMTRGYPYFLQEWGSQVWERASTSPITLDVVQEANSEVLSSLDQSFFRARFDRLTPGEKKFLRTMAELGQESQRTSTIAEMMGVKLSDHGPVRAKLIKKGVIYSPSHGELAFTVPLFDEFMRRMIPEFSASAR